jgi:hypothetical protein
MTNTHYILIESLENTYHAGGVVMLPIQDQRRMRTNKFPELAEGNNQENNYE